MRKLATHHSARRLILAVALLALVTASMSSPPAAAAGPQLACLAANPPNPASPNPCQAKAGDDWQYVAYGEWELRIERADGTVEWRSSAAGDPDISDAGVIRRGDVALGHALTPGSFIGFGTLDPSAEDPAPDEWPDVSPVVEDHKVVTSFDGTPIVWKLALPERAAADAPVPVLVAGHGWGGNRHALPLTVWLGAYLLDAGYALATFDSRGFGQSGGEAKLDSVDYEARDVSAIIDALAADPRIAQDASGDPRVGMFGWSYGGGVQFVAAARDARIDAIAPGEAWNDLAESLVPDGVYKAGWTNLLITHGLLFAAGEGVVAPGAAGTQTGAIDPMLPRLAVEGTTGAVSDEVVGWLRSRGPADLLADFSTPTMILHGAQDTLFPPSQAAANWAALSRRLHGDRLRMRWYCGGHGTCKPGRFPLARERNRELFDMIDFFDRWVRDDASVDLGAKFAYVTQDGAWHESEQFPPRAAALLEGTGAGIVPIGGEPSGGGGANHPGAVAGLAGIFLPVRPGVHAAPLRPAVTSMKVDLPESSGRTIAGAASVSFTATATGAGPDQAPLFLRLIDRTTQTVLGNQETVVTVPLDGLAHPVTVSLEPVVWTIAPYHDLALEITGSSTNFSMPRAAGAVRVDQLSVHVPLTR